MKNFIVFTVILPLLLVFVLQIGVTTRNTYITHRVTETVYAARDQAQKDGCFTPTNINSLKTKLAGIAGVAESEITITATTTPRYRTTEYQVSEQIEYEVTVPLKQIMAGHRLFGISDSQNKGKVFVKGSVGSELLSP